MRGDDYKRLPLCSFSCDPPNSFKLNHPGRIPFVPILFPINIEPDNSADPRSHVKARMEAGPTAATPALSDPAYSKPYLADSMDY
jgi:hypothetical protein